MALFLVCATRDNKSSKGSEVQGWAGMTRSIKLLFMGFEFKVEEEQGVYVSVRARGVCVCVCVCVCACARACACARWLLSGSECVHVDGSVCLSES